MITVLGPAQDVLNGIMHTHTHTNGLRMEISGNESNTVKPAKMEHLNRCIGSNSMKICFNAT